MAKTKTLFRYVPVGAKFTALDGTTFTRRKENTRSDLVRFCFDCQKRVGANAILTGHRISTSGWDEFVHFCPIDYVYIE